MEQSNIGFQQIKSTVTAKWDILFEEDPKEWIGFKPSVGDFVYPCFACCHMFSCLSSFQDHVNRRILVLKYNCPGCKNDLIFYNRCSFLLHTREHYSLREGKINLLKMNVFSLPVSLAGFLPHPKIPLIYATEESEITEEVYINTQFYTPKITDRGREIITLDPNEVIFRDSQNSIALKQICAKLPKCVFVTLEHQKELRQRNLLIEINIANNSVAWTPVEIKQEETDQEPITPITMPVISKVESIKEKIFKLPKCLECNTFQKCTMAEHFLGKNQPSDVNLKCTTCRFIASTTCSLKAHTRIHENNPPFVCPDCGKDFQSWALLHKHMDDVCFHLAKHVRFRCPGRRCGKLFAISTTFALHFQMHLKYFYTCSICSNVFHKSDDAELHRLSHNEVGSLKKTYECPLCPQGEPLSEDNYKAHVSMHATDTQKCMYVYMCKHCRSCFRSTATYATHLLKCTSKQNVPVRKYDIPRYITRKCGKCSNKIIFNEQRPATFCNKCKQQSENVKSTMNKKYFCVLCDKQIDSNDKSYHMKQCKFSTPYVSIRKLLMEDVQNYYSSSSSSSELDSTNSPAKVETLKCSVRDSPKTDDNTKKKRKRNYNPSFTKHKKGDKDVELDLIAGEPIQFDGTYHCKVCDFKNADRLVFHQHIKTHRDISTAYQCMECAECFVVKPSLVKHLLHFHNISDHDLYLQQNDCFDVEAVKELESIMRLAPGESKEPVKENQCRVCRQEFKDELTLNKHFRIHGMAFLLKNTK